MKFHQFVANFASDEQTRNSGDQKSVENTRGQIPDTYGTEIGT
jgi:hypothetical protein